MAVLRKTTGGYIHWCPGCEEVHTISTEAPYTLHWSFNGDVDRPTFSPSVRIKGKKRRIENGIWKGEWERDEHGHPVDFCCHYILTDGQLQYCGDSTHPLSGQTVPLPELPD